MPMLTTIELCCVSTSLFSHFAFSEISYCLIFHVPSVLCVYLYLTHNMKATNPAISFLLHCGLPDFQDS